MSRWTIRNPINIPIPNPIPVPNIKIGGTIGEAIDKVNKSINDIGEEILNYRGDIFEDLNDAAKNLVNDFEECIVELGGFSKDELATKLAKRVLAKLGSDINQDQFNNIFKDEAIAIYSEIYNIPSAGTCLIVVAGLMIAAAVIIITYAPVITTFAKSLISGGFVLAATGCNKYA